MKGKETRGYPYRGYPPTARPDCNTRNFVPYSLRALLFYVPSTNDELRDGAYGLSSLSENSKDSNHLQMLLQRQHFLISYLKTLSIGLARVLTHDLPHGSLILSQLS